MKTKWFLSPSALSLMRDCKRCFWLDKVQNMKRPRGIFPSLPSGMDRVIKASFDVFRKDGGDPLLAYLEGVGLTKENTKGIDLTLFRDQEKLNYWRNWRTGLKVDNAELNVTLRGAIDDLLIAGGYCYPFDYKTKGSLTTKEDAKKYYQLQLDCYSYMLNENGMPVGDFGFLAYYIPGVLLNPTEFKFTVQIICLDVSPNRAIEVIENAVALLEGPEPKETGGLYPCEYCTMGFGARS